VGVKGIPAIRAWLGWRASLTLARFRRSVDGTLEKNASQQRRSTLAATARLSSGARKRAALTLVHARTHGRTDGGCLASSAPGATRRVARFAILFTFSSATVAALVRRSSDDDGDRNSSSSSGGSGSSSGGSDAVIQYGSPHTCQNKRTERSARPGRAPNSNSPEGRSALSTMSSRVDANASRNHCGRRTNDDTECTRRKRDKRNDRKRKRAADTRRVRCESPPTTASGRARRRA